MPPVNNKLRQAIYPVVAPESTVTASDSEEDAIVGGNAAVVADDEICVMCDDSIPTLF